MPVKIHPHGYIIGGECDRLHRNRAAREVGGRRAVDWLLAAGVIRHVGGGWYRFTKRPTKAERALDWRAKEDIAGGNAETKNGCYRVFDDISHAFRQWGKAFRMSLLLKRVEELEGLEFCIGPTTESPLGPYQFGLGRPHRDDIYQARKRDGDFR